MSNDHGDFGYGQTPAGRDAQRRELESDAALPRKGEDCPLTAHLIQLALGQLDPSTDLGARVGTHVEQCGLCAAHVEGLRGAREFLPEDELSLDESLLGSLADLSADFLPEDEEEPTPPPPPPPPRRRLVAIAASILIVVVGVGAYSRGYNVGFGELIAQLEELRERLGLRQPVETEGFGLTQSDTLVLNARIDQRVIRKVIFRPGSGEEQVLYEATTPDEGIETIRAEKTYALDGPHAGKRITAEVECIPFQELKEHVSGELRFTKDILVAPTTGIVLDPPNDPIRLEITDTTHVRGEDRNIHGISYRDGKLYVLLRDVEVAGPWWVQNEGKGQAVRPGHFFMVPCKFEESANKFKILAVVVSEGEKWPFPEGTTEIVTLPPTKEENLYGPVQVTVVRD